MHRAGDLPCVARSWLGTRFLHQGRLKRGAGEGGGVDCLGLLVGVARELGLRDRQGRALAESDCADYGQFPDGEALRRTLAELLVEIPCSDVAPGDIALFRFDGNPQHLAIVGNYEDAADGGDVPLSLIHAYAPARKVVEHRLDAAWRTRMVAAFRVAAP